MTSTVDEVIVGYRIITSLGSGGMGDVYLVENTRLKRREALKVTQLSTSPEVARRFSLEASTMASFDHPSIATVYHYGIQDGLAWYSMQYLQGRDLAATDSLSIPEIITITEQIGAALDYAHRHGVIHRDVKPANIHIRRSRSGEVERATMLDFGVARQLNTTSVTHTNAFVGTLAYSAPEALGGTPSHPAADQYSFACTMFEQLTGQPPYPQRSLAALIAAHSSAPVPRISQQIPELAALDGVFARGLAKHPEQRFASCGDFAHELVVALRRAAPAPRGHSRANPDVAAPPPGAIPAFGVQDGIRPSGPIPGGRRDQLRFTDDREILAPPPRRLPGDHRPGRSLETPKRDPRFLTLLGIVAVVLTIATAGLAVLMTADESGQGSTAAARPSAVKRTTATGGGAPAGVADGAAGTWGMVIDPSGTTYAFGGFDSQDALLATAREKWGYDPRTWGNVYFATGCGAFALLESATSSGHSFQFGIGPDRARAEADALARAGTPGGTVGTIVDALCIGDELD